MYGFTASVRLNEASRLRARSPSSFSIMYSTSVLSVHVGRASLFGVPRLCESYCRRSINAQLLHKVASKLAFLW